MSYLCGFHLGPDKQIFEKNLGIEQKSLFIPWYIRNQ